MMENDTRDQGGGQGSPRNKGYTRMSIHRYLQMDRCKSSEKGRLNKYEKDAWYFRFGATRRKKVSVVSCTNHIN